MSMTPRRAFTAYFYPRSPCGERRLISDEVNANNVISIHALLAESDLVILRSNTGSAAFLSTLSLRRATSCNANINFTT